MSSRPFPTHVPTLTEVVEETPVPELDSDDAVVVADFVADLMAQPAPSFDVAVLTDVVPEPEEAGEPEPDVEEHLTDRLTSELTEVLQPILARHTEALLLDLQATLGQTLREMVAQAVAQELSKQRQL